MQIGDNDIEQLYEWVDQIPFSRPKKNLTRDFSDGVLMAELLKHFYPRIVELHNYSPVNKLTAKINNWKMLNKKVLSKLNLTLSEKSIKALASASQGSLDSLLLSIKNKVDSTSIGSVEQGDHISETNTKKEEFVPVSVVQNLAIQMKTCMDTITNLNQKVLHLEKIIAIKENIINELKDQVGKSQQYKQESNIYSL
uniref:Calponin-homology (CH) domain-containing protein n=1 Tax=Clastoptera arizonana TaxID=38151 RepID=A0A1B6CTH9_9HEMI